MSPSKEFESGVRSRFGHSRFALLPAARFSRLSLDIAEIIIQPVKPFFPEAPVMFEPICCILQRLCLEPARTPLSIAAAFNQAGVFQHIQMLGDGREAHVERPGKFGHRLVTGGKAGKNRTPGGIRQSRKNRVESI